MASVCISSGVKYTTDFTPCIQSTDANTLLLWKFQNVTGTTVSDESGNGYDLQLYNGPTSISDAPSQTCNSCSATDDIVVTLSPNASLELANSFDISTASYNGSSESLYISTQENQSFSLTFNNDGTKMFVMGRDGDDINEYTLSFAFDVSTATYS